MIPIESRATHDRGAVRPADFVNATAEIWLLGVLFLLISVVLRHCL